MSVNGNNEPRLKLKEYSISEISRPNIILGVPEVGLVGTIVTSYLAEKLGLKETGYIDSEFLPPFIAVHDGEPKYPIRLFQGSGTVILISEIPIPPDLSYDLTSELVRWGRKKNAKLVIGVTGLPSKRLDEKDPGVFCITNRKEIQASLSNLAVQPFTEGWLVGTYALLLRQCMNLAQPSLTLLAESHLQFPDPGAAAVLVNVLNRLLSINVDVKPLIEESEEIRIRMRELMKRTSQNMQQMARGPPSVYG
jgi:uncharacterized protein